MSTLQQNIGGMTSAENIRQTELRVMQGIMNYCASHGLYGASGSAYGRHVEILRRAKATLTTLPGASWGPLSP